MREGVFELITLKNVFNTADLLTKHLSKSELTRCVEGIGGWFAQGRSEIAPELAALSQHTMTPIILEALSVMSYDV